jgi:hypothetical protein
MTFNTTMYAMCTYEDVEKLILITHKDGILIIVVLIMSSYLLHHFKWLLQSLFLYYYLLLYGSQRPLPLHSFSSALFLTTLLTALAPTTPYS